MADASTLNEKIGIEYDVPLPTRVRATGDSKYEFDKMSIGASFFSPGVKKSSMWNTCYKWAKKTGTAVKFQLDYREEKGVPGTRVWRVK